VVNYYLKVRREKEVKSFQSNGSKGNADLPTPQEVAGPWTGGPVCRTVRLFTSKRSLGPSYTAW